MNKLSPPALRLSSKGDKNCHILRKSDVNCHIFDRTGQFSPTKLKRKPASNHFDGRWIKQVICRCMGGLATLTAPDNRDAETTADMFNHDGQLQSI